MDVPLVEFEDAILDVIVRRTGSNGHQRLFWGRGETRIVSSETGRGKLES